MLIARKLKSYSNRAGLRRFCNSSQGGFNVFAKISDGVGVPSNTGEASGKKRPPSKRVLELVDQILNLSLIEAADLCDICQERLSERSGGVPMRSPFVHPGSMAIFFFSFSGAPIRWVSLSMAFVKTRKTIRERNDSSGRDENDISLPDRGHTLFKKSSKERLT